MIRPIIGCSPIQIFASIAVMMMFGVACDDSNDEGLAPLGSGVGGMATGGMTVGGNSTGGMAVGGTTTGGTTTGGTTTGGTSTGGTGMGNMGGMTTVVPPMDDAGRCFEGCLSLIACESGGVSACGSATRAAFAATCQQSCIMNSETINSVTAAGCGSEQTTINALGLNCENDELCANAMCGEGMSCNAGTCSPFSCAPDMYDANGNNDQATAIELPFEPLVAPNLTICAGDRDWYVIDLPPNASLRVDLGFKDEQGDVDLKAYDEAGSPILSSVSGTDNERLTFVPSDEVRRIWLEVYVFSSGSSNPEMQGAMSQNSYGLYISTNLPIPVCQVTSHCANDDLCIQDVGVCAPPPPCLSDDECGFNGLCDIPSGRCIDCYTTEDCTSGVCDTASNQCVSCLTNIDCTDETRNICDSVVQTCVECAADTDCIDGTCNESNRCIPNSCNDANEPNDDDLTATMLNFNGGVAEVAGAICGDDDYFVFNANGGENLLISLSFIDMTGDLELAVIGPDEGRISRVTSTDNEILAYPNALAGQYMVRVYGAGFQVNQYSLRVDQNAMGMICNNNDQCNGGRCDSRETALCLPPGYCMSNRDCEAAEPICDLQSNRCKPCAPDGFEPNDSFEQAIPVNSVNGSLNTCGGPDFYAINAGAEQTIIANLSFIHMSGDIDIKLYDGAMEQVELSAGTMDGESIEHLVEVGGTFFLEVYGYSDAFNDYTMSVMVQ